MAEDAFIQSETDILAAIKAQKLVELRKRAEEKAAKEEVEKQAQKAAAQEAAAIAETAEIGVDQSKSGEALAGSGISLAQMRVFFESHDATKLFHTSPPSDEEIMELLAIDIVEEMLVETYGEGVAKNDEGATANADNAALNCEAGEHNQLSDERRALEQQLASLHEAAQAQAQNGWHRWPANRSYSVD
jgi:hypothetical protein